MLKFYGSHLCPYCREGRANFDAHGIAYEYFDINESLKNLAEFLEMRDTLPVFAALRAEGDIIALPAIVKEDGTVFADWEAYLQELGLDVVYREED
ncbi:MAG: glutaredoxin [Solobacterium sp.]|nr:glutaredoxin [Solobacterium sp.]MBQ1321750.1 glutaredoxin [Solobacterium sp.]MBR0213833.1 glutaredoxin [Solobacterium sp.]